MGVIRGVLVIVQRLPEPFGRRGWSGCQALIPAECRVAVAYAKGSGGSEALARAGS